MFKRDDPTWTEYTDCHKTPSGLKKLNFILNCISKYPPVPDNSKIKILEVGCGLGNISLPLASKGYDVTGIDIDEGIIEQARRAPFDNVTFLVGRTEEFQRFSASVQKDLFRYAGRIMFLAKKQA